MPRPVRRVIYLVAAGLVLAATACSGGDEASTTTTGAVPTTTTGAVPTTAAPALSNEDKFELQARAIARAWDDPRLCMLEDEAPEGLRAALAGRFDEVVYTLRGVNNAPAIGWDACTLVYPRPVWQYLPGVVGVDVWVMRELLNGAAATYLFRWDGDSWEDATPEETGVTVTTAVS